MNIVDFSEGILGINRVSAKTVAKCLRRFDLNDLANDLESGKRTDIEVIRSIGEQRLREIKEVFLADEKEEART